MSEKEFIWNALAIENYYKMQDGKIGIVLNLSPFYASSNDEEDVTAAELAEAGDEVAQKEVEVFYHYLTLGLYNPQFIFDPEKIILGGGVTAKEGIVNEINQRMK